MDWIQDIKSELPVILVSTGLSGIVGYIIGRYLKNKKRLFFEVKDVFLLQEHEMESFENLTLVLHDENGNKIGGNVLLAQFSFKNIGNEDIRLFKERGEELSFYLEKPFEIIDIGNSDDFQFDKKFSKVIVKNEVLRTGNRYNVGLVVQYDDDINIEKNEKEKLKDSLTITNAVDNLKKITGTDISISGFIGTSILILFLSLGIIVFYQSIMELIEKNWWDGGTGIFVSLLLIGGLGYLLFDGARREVLFRKRQQ